MASHQQDRTAFPDDEDLDDDDSQAEDDDVFDDDANSASTSSSLPTANPVPLATPSTAAKATVTVAVHSSLKIPSDPALPPSSTALSTVLASPVPISQRFDTPNDSRKLFQRLWTDEDEIELLQGFLDYTAQRGGGVVGAGHHDVFYDQIRSKLQLDFNKNQLVEKLRRLKKKYRNVVSKISAGKDVAFKSPHDKATFEISRKIWSNVTATRGPNTDNFDDEDDNINSTTHSLNLNHNLANSNANPNSDDAHRMGAFSNPKKRARSQSVSQLHQVKVEERNTAATDGPLLPNRAGTSSSVAGVIEETVRSCLSPLLKELVNGAATGGGGVGGMRGIGGLPGGLFNPSLLSFGGPSMVGFGTSGDAVEERWRKQQVLELEVYLKRLELMQDQIKAKLEELRSAGGA